jgi:pseudouridylate synthase
VITLERLQKVIASYGYTSRRKAEELIRKGKVMVNGKIITELGTKVEANDVISIDSVIINKDVKQEYYLLNKPRQVISSVEDKQGRITVRDLINTDARIYPIGRLDYDTTGLIILTNDGDLANLLMHPSFEVEKTYVAKVNKVLDKDDIKKIKSNIVVEGRKVVIKRFKIKKKDFEKNTSVVELTIVEGRNHIVKKIFASMNIDVIKLSRVGYAFLTIDNLKSGEYRNLTIKEIKKLYALKNTK